MSATDKTCGTGTSIYLIELVARLICLQRGGTYARKSWRAHWCAKAIDVVAVYPAELWAWWIA